MKKNGHNWLLQFLLCITTFQQFTTNYKNNITLPRKASGKVNLKTSIWNPRQSTKNFQSGNQSKRWDYEPDSP